MIRDLAPMSASEPENIKSLDFLVRNLHSACLILLLFIPTVSIKAESWHAISGDHFVVRYTKDVDTASEVLRIAEDFGLELGSRLGFLPDGNIEIWFCGSKSEFSRSLRAPVQDWAVGCAYPLQLRTVILNPEFSEDKRLNLRRIVKHEIAHVFIGSYVHDNGEKLPLWFNEGVVMHLSDDWDYAHYWSLLVGTLGNSIFPLSLLNDEFPKSSPSAQLAYAQSGSIVNFMVDRYGFDMIRQCLYFIRKGKRFEEALLLSSGAEIEWIENLWLRHIKKHYKWMSLISSWIVLWSFVLFIASLAYIRRKVKSRRIIKEWEEEEQFWNALGINQENIGQEGTDREEVS